MILSGHSCAEQWVAVLLVRVRESILESHEVDVSRMRREEE